MPAVASSLILAIRTAIAISIPMLQHVQLDIHLAIPTMTKAGAQSWKPQAFSTGGQRQHRPPAGRLQASGRGLSLVSMLLSCMAASKSLRR